MSTINYDELMEPVIGFLGCKTPQPWLDEALNNLEILMQDHANCEKKAASTAMNLMFRYSFFADLQIKLAQLVQDKVDGKVLEVLPGYKFKVELSNKHIISYFIK